MEKKILIRKKQENSLNKIVSKRLIFVVLILVTVSFSLFAKNDDTKRNQLFAVKTEYFEIIYPEKCRKSAEILYENADKIYIEVAGQYGFTPSFSGYPYSGSGFI